MQNIIKKSLFFLLFVLSSMSFSDDMQMFFQLLKEYKKHSEFSSKLDSSEKTKFESITLRHLKELDAKTLQARYDKYNVDYSMYRQLLEKAQNDLAKITKKLDQIPITSNQRQREEYALAAQKDRVLRLQRYLFYSSVNANNSILGAIKTFKVSEKVNAEVQKEAIVMANPDLPGVDGPSRQERVGKKDSERINLMPVDDEFYMTDLGRKLSSDLGGRADFWSYDFERDELYVQVGDNVGKLIVREDRPGVRFVQTRAGEGFSEPVGSAMKVDLFQSKGRFLTGDKNEETLFGPYPEASEKLLDERDPKVKAPPSDHP